MERIQENYQKMLELCEQLKSELKLANSEGKEKYVTRHKERGKFLARDQGI